MKKILLVLSFLYIIQLVASGQRTFTVAELNYMLSPNNSYIQNDTTSNAHYYSGFVNIPILLNDKSTLLTGIRGNSWKVVYSPEQIWPETYYSLGITLGYNHKFNKRSSFLFILIPRLNSDYRYINKNALQLGFFSTYSNGGLSDAWAVPK